MFTSYKDIVMRNKAFGQDSFLVVLLYLVHARARWLGNLGHFLSLLRNCCDLPIPVRGGCLFQIVRGTMYVCLTSYSFLKTLSVQTVGMEGVWQ